MSNIIKWKFKIKCHLITTRQTYWFVFVYMSACSYIYKETNEMERDWGDIRKRLKNAIAEKDWF